MNIAHLNSRLRGHLCRITATATAFAAVSVATASDAPTPTETKAGDDAILIYSAGIDAMLSDPHDAALRNALHMISDRVLELPAELQDDSMPAPMIAMALDALMGEMSMQAGILADADPAMGPPFYAQLTFSNPDPNVASQQAGTVKQMMQMSGMPMAMEPVPGQTGMMRMDLDGVPGFIGTTSVNNKPSFVLGVNEISTAGPALNLQGAPSGFTPVFGMSFDAAQVAPVMQMFLQQAPPAEAALIRTNLESMGMMGDHPMAVNVAMGHDGTRAQTLMRVRNFLAIPRYSDAAAREPISSGVLGMVPSDATMASIKQVNYAAIPDMVRAQMSQMAEMPNAPAGIEDPFAAITEMFGIDLENGLFNNLGSISGMYMSDRTGGGGFTSLVGFVEVRNEAGLRDTFNQVIGMANQFSNGPARGYVRIANTKVGGHDFMTLMFPGLPVPMELSMSITDGYLWYGLTPQAVVTGINFARSDEAGLTANATFRECAGTVDLRSATNITFADSPRLAAKGYGMTCMLMSGLANMVRSPGNPDRDPGMIVPPFNDLISGAKGTISITRYDGDDLVYHATADRSMVFNVAASIGAIGGSPLLLAIPALGAGIVMPAATKARENARELQAMSMMRQLGTACVIHASEFNDRFPSSIDALVEKGYIDREFLSSPLGPVEDGMGDYWIDTTLGTYASVKFPSRRIVGYDRASYINWHRVVVLFADGHVEVMDPWDFDEATMNEIHKDVDFNTPGW